MRPGIWQILIVVLVIVVIFGASRLPGVAKNVGKSMKVFRDEVKDFGKDEPSVSAPKDPSSIESKDATPGSADSAGEQASAQTEADDDKRK